MSETEKTSEGESAHAAGGDDATTATAPPEGAAPAPARASDGHGVDTAPCFCCASVRGVPTGRWWLLPSLSHHVRCVDCSRTFNARTGESNAPIFVLYLSCAVVGTSLGIVLYLLYRDYPSLLGQ